MAPPPQQNEASPERRMSFGSEIALQHGIHFEGKYIGSMEMGSSRPGTRYEILAAMRRVRYEFKARGIRKRLVDIVISVDGIKIVLQRKRKKHKCMDESKMLVMSHPMYRVYYVAHDSYETQIFCYVARDGASNSFKCNVFKCVDSVRKQKLTIIIQRGRSPFPVYLSFFCKVQKQTKFVTPSSFFLPAAALACAARVQFCLGLLLPASLSHHYFLVSSQPMPSFAPHSLSVRPYTSP